MNNWKILFDFQLKKSAEMLKDKNPKGLIFPIWSFFKSLEALLVRCAYKKARRKPVWLHSDRAGAGGDNGEAFFEYCTKNRPYITHVFVINKGSPDVDRLSKLGRVVSIKSFKHKLFFLLADKYFLSHPEVYFINPFGAKKHCYEDLVSVDLVFLQHGITQNDLSDWLGHDKMGFSLIVTAAQKEHASFLDAPYGYPENALIKCGFPRFDKLRNQPANKIIVMPSWRNNLVGRDDKLTNTHRYNPEFTKSRYFKFYNDLINDSDLLSAMRERDISGELFLHPSFEAQINDFEPNDVFKIMSPPYDYNQAFAEGSLLITDYSSVAFDFAYLKKPVVYCQFDKEEVYSGKHIFTKNYISAEKDGFGPVVYNYPATVKEVLSLIQRNFKIAAKYQRRAEQFYFHHDRNNCERLLRAVVQFDKEER
ncbi:CDP-glycerol glycerophosphotransferase family protein [Candidatus Saccharibacteria bacterium]|nr:CDP-glycerol glycerophosphotransferase family protein [Candidatus Saccharibacteria bacterium]